MPRIWKFKLTMMNLPDHLDRFVASVVKDKFRADLKLGEIQIRLPPTSLEIVNVPVMLIFVPLAAGVAAYVTPSPPPGD